MSLINYPKLNESLSETRNDFNNKKPFRYTVIENFFYPDMAEIIYNDYPKIENGKWDNALYVDQKNKFQKRDFEYATVLYRTFEELNSGAFCDYLEKITGIKDLHGDAKLFGGGLHQSTNGAYLNVHVDYNIHPETKWHRRINVLVYMNKDWKMEYEGYLELWDLTGRGELLANIAPAFNRCVIFETNEISFHGHPKPLKTPEGVNRKSIATYYYTETRPGNEIAPEHNTIYANTEGLEGLKKKLSTRVKIFLDKHINKK